MIHLGVPESVEKSFTLTTRLNHLELVMVYLSFESDNYFSEQLFAAIEEDFVADLTHLQGPRSVIQALKVLEDLVEPLDKRTQELIERDYSQDVEDFPSYLCVYGEAAWSKAFNELRVIQQDYKRVYKTCIDYILLGLNEAHPELTTLPACVFLKLASTPMLELESCARLFAVWRDMRGV